MASNGNRQSSQKQVKFYSPEWCFSNYLYKHFFFYFIARNFYFFMLIVSQYFLFYIPFFLAILIIATQVLSLFTQPYLVFPYLCLVSYETFHFYFFFVFLPCTQQATPHMLTYSAFLECRHRIINNYKYKITDCADKAARTNYTAVTQKAMKKVLFREA